MTPLLVQLVFPLIAGLCSAGFLQHDFGAPQRRVRVDIRVPVAPRLEELRQPILAATYGMNVPIPIAALARN